ncbi:hypothetical protein KDU71_22685 [Carboxylicivirga sediminis]|uniref:Lipoprotein n=1 Tax=Carboxylicivirga sediminis TaxID=2006564 RepID=A0A941J077_9BACT|nr:hypothetical protein [Carboxylicivirga sediminis]MBR8538395.1 hypothetical protein [Carboxylicivirga sediminis]
MKQKQLKLLGVLLFGLLLGCEQLSNKQTTDDTALEQRFFEFNSLKGTMNHSKLDFINNVLTRVKQQNDTAYFVPHFIKRFGYPRWEATRWFVSNDETVAQIPVYKDTDKYVRAIIIAAVSNDRWHIQLLVRNYFDAFIEEEPPQLNLEKVIDLFILADFKVFGHSSFLPYGEVSYQASEGSNRLKGTYVDEEKCYYLVTYNANWDVLDARIECETLTRYVPDGDATAEDPDGGAGGGTTPGGDNWYDPPCSLRYIVYKSYRLDFTLN